MRLLDGAGGDAAQRVDLIGHLVRGAAGLGGDLGEERFDLLDASGQAVLDRAEIGAGGGGDLLEQSVGVLQTAEHVGELAAQALVGAEQGLDRALGAFVDGHAHGLGRLHDRTEVSSIVRSWSDDSMELLRSCRLSMTALLRSSRSRRVVSLIAATSRPITSPRLPRLSRSDRALRVEDRADLADAAA